MKNPVVRIFVTGGHLTTALAVIEEIKRQKKNWEIIFVGRRVALEGQSEVSQEYRLITAAGLRFLSLTTGRLKRSLTISGLFSLAKVPLGFVEALWYVFCFRPTLIVSFGGYLAAPVVLAGWLLGVPAVTHEQTPVLGLTNKLILSLCRKLYVSQVALLKTLPKDKAVLTGLPIRRELFHPPPEPSFAYERHLPLIYITGGATGAFSLNQLVFPIVPKLVKDYMLIHETGSPSLVQAQKIQAELPVKERSRYRVAAFFDTPDVAWIYHKAILVIGRAGANTVTELAVLGKIAIFIPLPWSAGGEQQANAASLVEAGSAIMLDQKSLDSVKLEQSLNDLLKRRAVFVKRAFSLAQKLPRDGAQRVVAELSQILHS